MKYCENFCLKKIVFVQNFTRWGIARGRRAERSPPSFLRPSSAGAQDKIHEASPASAGIAAIRISPCRLIVILWLLLGITCIALVPIEHRDDLNYLGIAWNMFKAHSWLFTYSMADAQKVDLEKTPLLYWLILTSWHIFGVSDVVAKVVIFGIGTAGFWLTYLLARQLFPENPRIAWLSLLVLLCNFLWPRYVGSNIRFEGLVTLFGLLFLIFLLKYLRDYSWAWLAAAGIAFGFCLFAKGGVGFIYYLPVAILLPYLINKPLNLHWLLALIAVVGLALLLPAIYLVYLYVSLGSPDLHYLLVTQVSQRVGLNFQIKTLLGVIACFSPVILLFRFQKPSMDRRILILLIPIFLVFLFFALMVSIQSKRYLIPIFPLMALVIAYLIDQMNRYDRKIMGFAIVFSVVMMVNNVWSCWGEVAKYDKNVTMLGAEIRSLQLQGYPVALFTDQIWYQHLEFLGRLPKDLPTILHPDEQIRWLQKNPHGYLIENCEPSVKISPNCYQLTKDSLTLSVWNQQPIRYWPNILAKKWGLKIIPY